MTIERVERRSWFHKQTYKEVRAGYREDLGSHQLLTNNGPKKSRPYHLEVISDNTVVVYNEIDEIMLGLAGKKVRDVKALTLTKQEINDRRRSTLVSQTAIRAFTGRKVEFRWKPS